MLVWVSPFGFALGDTPERGTSFEPSGRTAMLGERQLEGFCQRLAGE